MKYTPKSPEYFNQFRNTPLQLKEFDPRTKEIARRYVNLIKQSLDENSIEVLHRGSTAFGISGKGDVDVAVYASNDNFSTALAKLSEIYGEPQATGGEFASFQQTDNGYEVEISLMKGNEAKVDLALTKLLLGNDPILQQYEELKKKYCFSKREYLVQREKFFQRLIEQL